VKFRSLLVANRGEIALRVMRTAKRMGLRTVAVYSEADRDAPHVRAADKAVHVGGSSPRESYLNVQSILQAEGDAVHPGYGFLSENPEFAEAVQKAGRIWIGPPPAAIRAMGDKANAKAIAAKAGVPVLPAYDKDPQFPLMIKALAGGGGRGIRIVFTEKEFSQAMKTAQSEAQHSFGDSRVLMEKALLAPRHVEVQIFADTKGNCIHLGERDCSVQRRHQKLVEESPSPCRRREAAGRDGRGGDRCGARRGLRRRGHRRIPARRGRPLLVHGDEHAPAGRAPRHRGAHRPRPGRVAAARRRRRAAASA
jgi:geranyl-CoA carboxylase alpha subunit